MIFVTGGTGLIGYHFTSLLAAQGEKLCLLIRKEEDKTRFANLPNQENLQFVIGDLLDTDSYYAALNDARTVIHAAALVSFNESEHEHMLKTNVEGTANLVNCALETNIEHLYYLSSIAALGRHDANIVIDENTKWKESDWNSQYGKSKYLAELEVWRGVEEGLTATILNPSIVLGKNLNWNRSSAGIIPILFKNSKYYIDGSFNYVDLRDLGQIFLALFHNPEQHKNQRYLINNRSVTVKELFTTFNTLTQRQHKLVKVAPFFLTLLLGLQWLRTTLLGKKSLVSNESLKALQFSANYNNSKVKTIYPTEMHNLSDTISWLTQLYVDKI